MSEMLPLAFMVGVVVGMLLVIIRMALHEATKDSHDH